MKKAEEICSDLGLDYSKIANIYCYGSKTYGTDNEYSDDDYIIVYKSVLPSGSFKDNAISSPDRKIQGVCYSRSGFLSAIDEYEIGALECLSLPEDKIIQKIIDFKIRKFDTKYLAKKIIQKASSSFHFAKLADESGNTPYVMKNVFHALRILDFGFQIKEHQRIVDFTSMNTLMDEIYKNHEIRWFTYKDRFNELSEKLKQ
jgi:hypothetical protein